MNGHYVIDGRFELSCDESVVASDLVALVHVQRIVEKVATCELLSDTFELTEHVGHIFDVERLSLVPLGQLGGKTFRSFCPDVRYDLVTSRHLPPPQQPQVKQEVPHHPHDLPRLLPQLVQFLLLWRVIVHLLGLSRLPANSRLTCA